MPKSALAGLLRQQKQPNLIKKLTKKLTKIQKKPGHFEGKFWVWGDGKKTHINFLRMSITTKRPMPPGFYKFCANSKNPGLIKMGKVAKHFKLKELR
jgi:hypothetical protein